MNARVAALALLFAGCAGLAGPDERRARVPGENAAGFVFDDRNANGRRDPGEPGIAGVAVSNGSQVVLSDAGGRYALPVGNETILFVVKPRGWMTPVDENQLPRFHYVHKPAGSPAGLLHPGVAPTGPLPDSVDFPLRSHEEPDAFHAIVFGDTQPYTLREIDHLSHDVIEELVGTDAAFGITLGDLVGDDLSLFEPLNQAVSRIGIPWYNAIGNHDMNYRAGDDEHSDETFERIYGPPTYAFQYGRVHFLVLDDVIYGGATAGEISTRNYVGGITDRQLVFVRNYLATVPREDLVVLALHIPLTAPPPHFGAQRAELLEILSEHPRTISFSAHAHTQFQRFLGARAGYTAKRPHHHVNVGATSGSWWSGRPDELGIPHATMRCGSPNGYAIVRFDGNRYSVRFKAARRPADHQLTVFVADAVAEAEIPDTEVLVNVFAGSERSVVEMRWREGGAWTSLTRVGRVDPYYAALVRREADFLSERGYALPPPVASPHLWAGHLPPAPGPGTRVLEVRTTDVFGQTFTAYRLIRIEPDAAPPPPSSSR
jgi:hypothetical protein